jgi:O-antigen ligase
MDLNHSNRAGRAALICALGFVACIPLSLMGMQILGAAGGLLGLAALLRTERRPPMPLDLAVLLYLLAILISWVPVLGLPWDALRMTAAWPAAAYLLFRAAGAELARGVWWRRLWLLTAIVAGLYAVLQYAFGVDLLALDGSRLYPAPANPAKWAVIGFFDRHHSFGVSAAFTLAVLVGSVATGEKLWRGLFPLVPIGLAVGLSQSRAAVLSATLALLAWASLRRSRNLVWLGLFAALAAGLALLMEPGLGSRLVHLWDASHDASRLQIWAVSTGLIDARPACGWGFGRFFLQSEAIYDQLAPLMSVRSGTHLHLLAAWLDGGLLFAVAWAGLWTAAGLTAWRLRENPAALGLGLGLTVLWIAGFGHNVMVDGELSWPMWASLGWLGALDAYRSKQEKNVVQKT